MAKAIEFLTILFMINGIKIVPPSYTRNREEQEDVKRLLHVCKKAKMKRVSHYIVLENDNRDFNQRVSRQWRSAFVVQQLPLLLSLQPP